MRPIDADAALKALRKCQTYLYDTRDPDLKIKLSSAKAAINNLPTIQPEKAQLFSESTTSDPISRQAAIDAIDCINGVEEVLRSLPSVQPEPQWIPVSERLPEDLEEVNVTWVNRNPESYYESIKDKPFTTTAVYYKGEWYWLSATCVDYLAEYGRCDWNKVDKAIEIVAWMPLPEAYKPNK